MARDSLAITQIGSSCATRNSTWPAVKALPCTTFFPVITPAAGERIGRAWSGLPLRSIAARSMAAMSQSNSRSRAASAMLREDAARADVLSLARAAPSASRYSRCADHSSGL